MLKCTYVLAKEIISAFNGELIIADFGCSHGKNSMTCIKAAMDGCADLETPVSFIVYLNDLPSNDFDEVKKCLEDSNISYEQHPVLKKHPDTNLATYMIGKSFYSVCLPHDHINLGFSFNCLHWMKDPLVLSKSIVHGSTHVTPKEQEDLAKIAHQNLFLFLKNRAYELQKGGRLVCTIMKEFQILRIYDQTWLEFLEYKGQDVSNFEATTIPLYFRT